jgi:peptidase, S41 family
MINKLYVMVLAMVLAMPAWAQKEKNHDFVVAKNMDVFTSIYKNLDMMYVDTLDADEVIGNGINAMLRSLDPYTEYYPESEVKELKNMLTGKYAGIGSVVRYNYQLGYTVISEPYEGMPAQEAGLKKGDIILSINDSTMKGKEVSYVSDRLRGEPGTSFILKVKRPSTGKVMKVKLTRRTIQMPFLPYYGLLDGGIGYINFNSFTDQCAKDVRRAFIDLKKQGAKKLVFDLRNNGGGSVSEAVSIVNMFLPKDKVVLTMKGKLQRANNEYKTTVEPIDTLMPIVVLVSGNTASAAEILSGSLQDYDRAIILGTRTYGKGLVQATMDLPYNGQMKLTTSKYYIPSGRCVQALNYKHAKGGYVEHVPDSLTKVFYTAGGREVRDGGGVKPDVEVKPDSLPNIAYYLAGARDSNELMLNYEVDYIAKHPTIAPAKDFALTDADYEEFKARVLKADFKYDRETEKYLKDLMKLARFEGYYDDAKPEFDALAKKLSHNVAKDLDYNKQYIKRLLENDIVAAYYYQGGAIRNSLRYDKQVKEAVRLLNAPEEYKKLLRPSEKEGEKVHK